MLYVFCLFRVKRVQKIRKRILLGEGCERRAAFLFFLKKREVRSREAELRSKRKPASYAKVERGNPAGIRKEHSVKGHTANTV